MTLRYEDLVTEPERELRRVCAFIGEDYEPAMLDSRESAANVAAEHEWWKESVAGPLQTTSVGRWRDEMSADARRFAALHLAGYLREHGYEGAHDARGEVARAARGSPRSGTATRACCWSWRGATWSSCGRCRRHPWPSTRGSASSSWASRASSTRPAADRPRGASSARAGSASGCCVRRLRGRPVLWVRRATLHERRRRRSSASACCPCCCASLAREVELAEVPALVEAADAGSQGT